ncbi:MAG: protein phosphatase 2C domain-containing protein [Bacteroidetes bacterium]|jgi:hypothetical protein|nr:protein phosphatase 2C domain-containing protein [Bacteroidota bacterium]
MKISYKERTKLVICLVREAMKIHSFIKKGTAHPNFCEDFLLTFEITSKYSLFAVMDGCSSGKESHFASAFFGKIFKKIALKKSFELLRKKDIDIQINDLSTQIIKEFWEELVFQKGQLLLNKDELLSTFLVSIYDRKNQNLVLNIAGDGCFSVNQEIIFSDQKNHPNYPIFHVSKPFDEWFKNEVVVIEKTKISDFSIATDGIESFIKGEDLTQSIFENPPFLFLSQTEFLTHPNPLLWQFRQLDKKDILPFDDLSIIRIVNP